MRLQLSKTSEKILKLFLASPSPLYVNEIIRKTNFYPNAVQRSLKTLGGQNIVSFKKQGNKKFYFLNKDYKYYSEIMALIGKSGDISKKPHEYIKWVNRECSVALNTAIGYSQCKDKYIKRFRLPPVNFLWYNSVTGGVYNKTSQIKRIGKVISQEIKKDSKFAKSLADSCIKDGEKLILETRKIAREGLSKLGKKELYSRLNKLHELFLHFMPYFVIPHAIEKAIEAELNMLVFDPKVKDILVEPVDVISGEQVKELRLTALVKEYGWTRQNRERLSDLTQEFCWLPMMALYHKPFGKKYFKKIIDDLVISVKDPVKELKKLKDEEGRRKKRLEDALKEIKADKGLKDLVYTTQAYLKLRTYRVNIVKKFHYYHLSLLAEIAKKIGITKAEIAYLTYPEILEALKKRKQYKKLKVLVRERKKGFANLTWQGRTRVISGVKNIIEAIEQYNIFSPAPDVKKEIKGKPACQGITRGRVKIVNKLSELSKVKKGDVLVAKMTTPDYMVAINKAVAIVTNEGGITCHAAIVSREFNLPCVIGTRNATQVLADDDLVEVNANQGIVKVIESTNLPEDVKIFRGKTIYKGKVEGKARIILDTSDFEKLKEGDIIIASQTTPDYLSLLYRAKGFVVDEESLTSHAILYGRALKTPSIMGTSFARNVIKDGERVELDASRGLIKRLK